MSKSKELQNILDKKAGFDIKESNVRESRLKEIMDLKLKIEKIQNDLNECKGLPRKSPILKRTIQESLDTRAGVRSGDIKSEKKDAKG